MAKSDNPFRWFDSSPEVIRLVVMMYVKYPLSLRNVEDLLHERDIDFCHETVRHWWNRFGPMFAAEIRRKRVDRHCQGKWIYLDFDNSQNWPGVKFQRNFHAEIGRDGADFGLYLFALTVPSRT